MTDEIYWNSQQEREDEFLDMLQRKDQEAKEYAAALDLPGVAGYDVLAVVHGQALLGEREAFQIEASLSSSEYMTSSSQSTSSPLQKGEEALTDEVLINMLRSDPDSNAFGILYERYHTYLVAYAMRHHGDYRECEAIVQETLVRVYRHFRNGNHDKIKLRTWLRAVVDHQIRDVIRRRGRVVDVQGVEETMNTSVEKGNNSALRAARLKKQLSQAELAEAIGVDERTIQAWESDGPPPDRHDLQKFYNALGIADDEDIDGFLRQTLWQTTLRAARLKKCWTQEEAAKMLQVNTQTYKRWELGIQQPQPGFFQMLRRVFELPDEAFKLIYPLNDARYDDE